MKQKINLLVSILLILTLASCTTERKCNRKFPPQTMVITKDSIIRTTNTVYSDTTIYVYIKGDTITDSVLIIKGTSIRPSILTTDFAYSKAWVQMGLLRHELRQNDTTYQLRLDNAIRATWISAERFYSKSEVQVKENRFIPKWVWWVLAFVVINLIYCAYRVWKIFKI